MKLQNTLLLTLLTLYICCHLSSNLLARPIFKNKPIKYGTYSNWVLNCPSADGFVDNERARVLDSLKNRTDEPVLSDFTSIFTWNKILERGEDRNRFDDSKATIFEGYVVKIKHGNPESCNCLASDLEMEDTHIELAKSDAPNDTVRNARVVVEITPRIRHDKGWIILKNNDESLLHRMIKITGWLMYDYHHRKVSANTTKNPDAETVTRVTVWEVHPVTNIEIVGSK